MNLSRFAFLIGTLTFALPVSSQSRPSTRPVLEAGVAIEKVESNSEAEKAGLRAGDVLLSWTRGEDRGTFQSPLDLSFVDLEERPRGPLIIKGLSGTNEMVWAPAPECICVAGIEVRPNFLPNALVVYRRSRRLLMAGKMHQARQLWQELAASADSHDAWLYPWLLYRGALSLVKLRQWKDIDLLMDEASRASQKLGPAVAAYVYRCWGYTFSARGNLSEAIKSLEQALKLDQEIATENLAIASDWAGIACAKSNPAVAQKDLAIAIKMQERLAPNSFELANSLVLAAYLASEQGNVDDAEQYYEQALAIQVRLRPGNRDMAMTLLYLGSIAYQRGNLSKAEEYYRRAVSSQQNPDRRIFALALDGLSAVALSRGQPTKASYYSKQAIAIHQRLATRPLDIANALNNLGIAATHNGDLLKADRYERRAIRLYQKYASETVETANVLSSLGDLSVAQGHLRAAERYYNDALAIEQSLTPTGDYVADTLQGLAVLYRKTGRISKAEESYRTALAIWEKTAPGSASAATALGALAEIMQTTGQPEEAAKFYSRALNALENQTSHLGGTEDVRSGFRARHEDIYRNYIDLLVSQGQPDLAFQVLEQSRARSLLESLAAAHLDVHKGADPNLLEQERYLRQMLTVKSSERLHLLSGIHSEEQLGAIEKQITDLVSQYKEVEGQLRNSSPAYAALTQPQTLSVGQVQQEILDDDSVLLEYSLGERHSYLFVLTRTSLKSYVLPGRKVIQQEARRAYGLLRLRTSGQLSSRAMARLSQMILGPAASELDRKRLLVVSDGALAYIPFGALPAPRESDAGPQLRPSRGPSLAGGDVPGFSASRDRSTALPNSAPLIVDHEVLNLPSASVLAVLRQQVNGRAPAPKAVAILADPVFSKYDSRVKTWVKNPMAQNQNEAGAERAADPFDSNLPKHLLVRSAADVRLGRNGILLLSRLPFTRREAQAIAAVTLPEQRLQALDFRASRSTAISPDLAQYRIVHFATHGLLDSRNPELSGLVLSLVDEHGQPQNGFLELEDIYNLNLSADLVVLSACETGLGKEIDGEGLVGLTRGFMYAGANRVLSSLWRVDDEATAALMKKFYQAMLKDGETPAQALRSAQMWMRKQKVWAPPYYWAGFVLQGDWK